MPIKIVKNGTQWTIREGYERIQDSFGLDDLSSGLNGKDYKLIKENNVRSVISMPVSDINENGIYIKYFKRKGYFNYIKYLFVPTRTRTEWKVGNALLRENIKTALPLAIAEKTTYKLQDTSLLVTEAITNSEMFHHFCQANYSGTLSTEKVEEKNEILRKLALFLRDIHEKGFCHYDFHAGNILIKFKNRQSKSIQDCTLYVIDLHSVKILKQLSIRKRLLNFAQIFNSLSSILTKNDKLDLVRSYGTNALGGSSDEYALVKQIETQSLKSLEIRYRSRRKRCLKERSSVFTNKRLTGMKMFYRKCYDKGCFQELIEKHNSTLAHDDKSLILKRDLKTALTRSSFKDNTIQNVVIKQYSSKSGFRIIKNIFRRSAGKRAWVAGNGLRVYGFNTPEPMALIEQKMFGINTDSYLIMEEIQDSMEMDRYILSSFHDQSSIKNFKKKKTFINNLAKTIGKMHNHNIFHHDLKTCNIMVKEIGESFDFIFLDFDKVSFEKNITIRNRLNNLTQINYSTPRLISLTDRYRFLKEYLKQCALLDKKKYILRELIRLNKARKFHYVSFNGDVTEDW
ncbi:MAG: lipopolysaccharide kinase InaA family protein [Planctomycetota bacterium]|jgi:tRNA A-37 threonylcarbamoyl transferase component Bud32